MSTTPLVDAQYVSSTHSVPDDTTVQTHQIQDPTDEGVSTTPLVDEQVVSSTHSVPDDISVPNISVMTLLKQVCLPNTG